MKNQNFATKGHFGLVFISTAFPWAASSKILYNIAQCLTETLFLVPVMRVMDGFGRNLTEQGRRQKQIRKILELNPKNLCNFTAWIFMIFFDDFSQYYKVGSSLEIVCEVREKRGQQFDSKNLCFTWKLSSLNTKNSVQITFLSVNIYLQKIWTIVEKNHENIVTHSNVDRYKSNRDEGRRL